MESTSAPINILLVEDDEIDILSIQSEFNKLLGPDNPDASFHFEYARNGVEALNKLYGKNGEQKISPIPNVILLDMHMPKMDGTTFLKELRNDPEFDQIAVYILTGLYGTKEKIATQNLKVTGRIIKPIQHDDALRVYMTALGIKV